MLAILLAAVQLQEVVVPSWIQCPDTLKLIPRDEWYAHREKFCDAPTVYREFESFKSPIDGSAICDRGQLNAHNKRHGVTDMRDYGGGYIEKQKNDRESKGQRELNRSRKQDLYDAVQRHGG